MEVYHKNVFQRQELLRK